MSHRQKTVEVISTSFEYSILGSVDVVIGDGDRDYISTGGGNDRLLGAGDDVVVQGEGEVEVDTGIGDDRVVEEVFGTLFVKNGAGLIFLSLSSATWHGKFVDGKLEIYSSNGATVC